MMKLVFNGTKELEIETYFEHITAGVLNASRNVDTEAEEIPDLTEFKNFRNFETVEILDGEKELPVVCAYDTLDITASFSEDRKFYGISVVLTKKE